MPTDCQPREEQTLTDAGNWTIVCAPSNRALWLVPTEAEHASRIAETSSQVRFANDSYSANSGLSLISERSF